MQGILFKARQITFHKMRKLDELEIKVCLTKKTSIGLTDSILNIRHANLKACQWLPPLALTRKESHF